MTKPSEESHLPPAPSTGNPKEDPLFLRARKVEAALILCHRQADVDAYCSAYAIASRLRRLHRAARIKVVAPEGLSLLARQVQSKLRWEVSSRYEREAFDLIVVVDTGHSALLSEWLKLLEDSKAVKLLLDHHPPRKTMRALFDEALIDPNASSTSELVYRAFAAAHIKPSKAEALAILTGILFDSQHLTLARCRTLEIISKLCLIGATIREAKSLLRGERSKPESIARLKAAQRAVLYRVGNWLLATTSVGSFQSSASRALVELGADIAWAIGQHDSETRVSFRSTQEFFRSTELHLGSHLAEKASARLESGIGGGHPTAASLTSKTELGQVGRVLLTLLSDLLGEPSEAIR